MERKFLKKNDSDVRVCGSDPVPSPSLTKSESESEKMLISILLCVICAMFERTGSIDMSNASLHFKQNSELNPTVLPSPTRDVTLRECTIFLLKPSEGESLYLGRTVIMWNVSLANVYVLCRPFLKGKSVI